MLKRSLFLFQKLNAIHELQVLEAIANYFEQGEKSYEVKQFVFSSLFGNHLDDRKLDLLSKLVSMAVAVRSRPLLDCVAVLMQVNIQPMYMRCLLVLHH